MKLCTFLLVVLYCGAIQARFNFTALKHEWENFKVAFGKEYETLAEEMHRLSIFIDNRLKIDEHNRKYEAGLVSFTVGMNQFGDLTLEDLYHLLKISKHRNGNEIRRDKFVPQGDFELPESIDWRDKGAVTPIEHQLDCESCYAFSVVGSIESQHFLKTGELLVLSKQQIIDCSENYGNLGCDGGMPDWSYKYVVENGGLTTEENYPYVGVESTCQYNATDVAAKITSFVDIESGNEAQLKEAVATIGPVTAPLKMGAMFHYYVGGVYEAENCATALDDLDHGVVIVGYGRENGLDYWLLKNSWGTGWGQDGYMKLRRNANNMCGIATGAVYPVM